MSEGYNTKYDWNCAFYEAQQNISPCVGYKGNIHFSCEDVEKIISSAAGENDGRPWLCVGKMKDGRYFSLEASCDYTGWECQANGSLFIAATLADIQKYGCTDEARERLFTGEPMKFHVDWL